MGYVMLGLAAGMSGIGSLASRTAALNGAVFQMLGHGIITGALFFLVGMVYHRTHTRLIADYGGIRQYMPVYAGLFSLAAFASLGLPGLAGFIGEFLVFAGTFGVFPVLVGVSLIGVVITAAYLLWTVQRVFLGEPNKKWVKLKDLSIREKLVVVSLGILMIVLGVAPAFLLNIINVASTALLG